MGAPQPLRIFHCMNSICLGIVQLSLELLAASND